jgi:hypothetical protein
MEQQGAIGDMPIEEKLALRPDTDKAYLRGYLDRALFEARGNPRPAQSTKEPPSEA